MKEGHAKHAPFAYVYKFYYVFLLIFFPLSFLVSVSSHKVFWFDRAYSVEILFKFYK
jgi:hypothetical protein